MTTSIDFKIDDPIVSLEQGTITFAAGSVPLSALAKLGGPSQLLGSSSTSSAATDISLGKGLNMAGSVLGLSLAFGKWVQTVNQILPNSLPGNPMLWQTQETPVGNATTPTITISMAVSGTATIASTSTQETAFKLTFHTEGAEDTTPANSDNAYFAMRNTVTSTQIGQIANVAYVGSAIVPSVASTSGTIEAIVVVPPASSLSFNVVGGGTTDTFNSLKGVLEPYLIIQQIY